MIPDPDGAEARVDAELEPAQARFDSQLKAIGLIVRHATMMDRALEMAFCALVGSKYAAVVASGRNTSELVDYCVALVDAHAELPKDARDAINDALQACRAAGNRRGDFVHSIFGNMPADDSLIAVKANRRSHRFAATRRTREELFGVAAELKLAEGKLARAITDALGWESGLLWAQLRADDSLREQQAH